MEFVLKAKNTLKRIAAIGTITMMGITAAAGAVAAADLAQYPSLFVEDGLWAAQIVMGNDAKPADIIGATNLAVSITNDAGVATATATTLVEGGAKLETSDNRLNFYEEINAPRGTLTDSQLPVLLADGKYMNDKGVVYDYTQQVELAANTMLTYDEFDDVSESPDSYLYQTDNVELLRYKMIFTNAAESDVNSAGELADFKDTTIVMLGREYEITGADIVANGNALTLYMMGGAAKASMFEGDSATYTIDGVDFEVEISYIGAASTKMKINGESTKELREGQTDKVAGIVVGVKEILENEAGEVNAGRDQVEFYLGADKVTLYDDSVVVTETTAATVDDEVKVSEDTIDGVYVDIVMTEVSGTVDGNFDESDVWELNSITLLYYPDDPMYVYKEHPYVDPAFGDWKIELTQVVTENEETIKVSPDTSNRVKVTIPLSQGEVDLDAFYYTAGAYAFGKEATKQFINNENTDLFTVASEKSFFVVSSANNKESYLMQIHKIDVSDNQVTFKDVMTGDKYLVSYTDDNDNSTASDGQFTIGSLTIDIAMADGTDGAELGTAADVTLFIDMDDSGTTGNATNLGRVNIPFYTKGGAIVAPYTTVNNAALVQLQNQTAGTFTTITADIDGDGTADLARIDVGTTANCAPCYLEIDSDGDVTQDYQYALATNYTDAVNDAAETVNIWYNGVRSTWSLNDAAHAAATAGVADIANISAHVEAIPGTVTTQGVSRAAGVSVLEEYQDEGTAYGAIYIPLVYTNSRTDVGVPRYTQTGGAGEDTTVGANALLGATITTPGDDDADFGLNAILDTDVTEDYTEYGSKVTFDESSSDQSWVSVVYTDSEAYGEAWLSPAGATVIVSGAAGGAGYSMPTTTIAVSDAEANTAKHLILIGGPCINKLTAQAMGLSYPACGAASGVPENAGLIKVIENAFDGKTAMIIAGWDAADTTAAVNIVRDYKAYSDKLIGTGVKVVGTTVTAMSADPVVEEATE